MSPEDPFAGINPARLALMQSGPSSAANHSPAGRRGGRGGGGGGRGGGRGFTTRGKGKKGYGRNAKSGDNANDIAIASPRLALSVEPEAAAVEVETSALQRRAALKNGNGGPPARKEGERVPNGTAAGEKKKKEVETEGREKKRKREEEVEVGLFCCVIIDSEDFNNIGGACIAGEREEEVEEVEEIKDGGGTSYEWHLDERHL